MTKTSIKFDKNITNTMTFIHLDESIIMLPEILPIKRIMATAIEINWVKMRIKRYPNIPLVTFCKVF